MSVKEKAKDKLTTQQRLEFVKQIEELYEANNVGLRKIALNGFVKGVATGLGVFLGGTIVVALLLWILTLLNHVPFIGEISESAQRTIQQSTPGQ